MSKKQSESNTNNLVRYQKEHDQKKLRQAKKDYMTLQVRRAIEDRAAIKAELDWYADI